MLSTKDLCGLEFIPNLIDAGVMCFKIEGRMKSPDYVATVTKIYRKYIDLALSNKPYVIEEQDKKDLLQVFNRGGFSSGHLSSDANKNLVYKEKPNHMGIYLGNVSNLKPNKGHVLLQLNEELSVGDTIMFERESSKYTVSELMIKNKNFTTVNKKQLVEIGRMKGNIKIGDKIYKVASKNLSASAKASYQGENKKVGLEANIILKENLPISLTVKTLDAENTIFEDISASIISEISPIRATSRPIDKQRIISQLSKTNNTIFEFKKINVDLEDNLFVPSISVLNELRRNILQQITNIAKDRIYRRFANNINFKLTTAKKNTTSRNISILLNTLKNDIDYENINENVSKIYLPLKFFASKKYENTIKNISNKFDTYIYLPTIVKSNYSNILNNAIENSIDKFNIKGFVVSNISCGTFIDSIRKKYGDKFEYIANYTLNVYNSHSENELTKLGIKTITISPELNKETISNICSISSQAKRELIVYGNTPLMSTNYCFLGSTNRCYPTCGSRCKQDDSKYYLRDRLGFSFRILPDSTQTVTTIYNSKITSINGNDFDVDSYRIDIIDESICEINNIIQTALEGKRLEGKEFTNGNLSKEI